jgi:hypothetical protein
MVWREVKKTVNLQLKRKHFISHRQWLFDFLAKATELQATTLAVGCCISGKPAMISVILK